MTVNALYTVHLGRKYKTRRGGGFRKKVTLAVLTSNQILLDLKSFTALTC
jgi:hypothetical protein